MWRDHKISISLQLVSSRPIRRCIVHMENRFCSDCLNGFRYLLAWSPYIHWHCMFLHQISFRSCDTHNSILNVICVVQIVIRLLLSHILWFAVEFSYNLPTIFTMATFCFVQFCGIWLSLIQKPISSYSARNEFNVYKELKYDSEFLR